MPKKLLGLLILVCSVHVNATKKSTAPCRSSKKLTKRIYSPKSPHSGFGKKSSVNGKIKTKSVSGHFKPSNGYKFVNPYSRTR